MSSIAFQVFTVAIDLLEVGFDDSWSDDELEPSSSKVAKSDSKDGESTQSTTANDATSTLGIRLKELIQALGEDDAAETSESSTTDDENVDIKGKGKASAHHKGSGAKVKKPKDNDSYYFDSYAANGESQTMQIQDEITYPVVSLDIHELMLRDTTRTVSYGRFILSNPAVFKDKLVMDVGCGTGILSSMYSIPLKRRSVRDPETPWLAFPVFAARAGAKHVYAIEASGFANKARQNIKNNGLENVIT